MKNHILTIALAITVFACKEEKKAPVEADTTNEITQVEHQSFGDEIIADDAIAAKSMAEHYKNMQVGDSIPSKITAKVSEVCKAKGCWMTLDLENGEEVMVKFKDYAFFMPKDIEGKEVIINGNAYIEEVSVDDQRHYAEDKGATQEEIAAITAPKRTYSFEADGVLLKQ